MNKQKLSILLAVIAAIGAVGGGSYALDFSNTQTTNTDNSQSTIINEGDTIINEAVQQFTDEIFDDLIDYAYDEYCEEIDPGAEECDDYWGEP
jgi:hypothetical protein